MCVVRVPLDARFFVHPDRRAEIAELSAPGEDADAEASSSSASGSHFENKYHADNSHWKAESSEAVQSVVQSDPMFAARLNRTLTKRWKVQTVLFPLERALWCRLSAQVYNTLEDYKALARAICELDTMCTNGGDPLTDILEPHEWGFSRVGAETGQMMAGLDQDEARD